ncbi:hypothetical protein F5884DRAFT_752362 [Xylogone sp. PMI_703]|nr:hypothetical protein F5884DRAFT_752362 [Xylogone sp. PMI_703]
MQQVAITKRRSRAKGPGERKRAIYVPEACTTCKKRKVRCNGKVPCDVCRKYSIDCQYLAASKARHPYTPHSIAEDEQALPDIDEASEQPSLQQLTNLVTSLQEKVTTLEQRIHYNTLTPPTSDRDELQQYKAPDIVGQHVPNSNTAQFQRSNPTAETHSIRSPSPPLPDFNGPTSSNFSFSIAKMILKQANEGFQGPEVKVAEIAGSVAAAEEEFDTLEEDHSMIYLSLWNSIDLEEALRLIDVYNEVVGILHPLIDIDNMKRQAEKLYSTAGQVRFSSEDDEVNHLTIVIAIALLAEGGGYDSTAVQLQTSLQSVVAKHILSNKFVLRKHILLLLTGICHMFEDNWRLASRTIAIAARIIIEAGLHRKQVLLHRFPDKNERAEIVTVLYTSIILDRQINFAAGLPFTFRDTDIDIPELEDKPYMKAMASYVQFGAQAWSSVTDNRGRIKPYPSNEVFDYLDYQVRRWQESLPIHLRPHQYSSDAEVEGIIDSGAERATFSLRSILYLRANQIRILTSRPLLFSLQSINANPHRVAISTEIARDTIDRIVDIDEKSDLYRKQQPILNHFLSSALSALFLVVAHFTRHGKHIKVADEPLDIVSIRGSISKALRLLRSYSSCRSSQRLWNKFTNPKDSLSPFGLLQSLDEADSASNASSIMDLMSTNVEYPLQGNASQDHPRNLPDNEMQIPLMCFPAGNPGIRNNSDFSQHNDLVNEMWPVSFSEIGQFLVGNDFNVFYDDML